MSRAPKSRFRSAAGKKIEKQVRKDATRFHTYANNRRRHDVASGANHRGKLIVDSKNQHKRDILSNGKLASSAMKASETNKRDNVANEANRQDNTTSLLVGQNSSTRNVSLNPLQRNASNNNRRDDGVPYCASQLDRQNLTKDKNIKLSTSLAMLSRTENERSVADEANRQVNHASRPIKQDPPRKNTNTKRVDAIMPNGSNHASQPIKHDPPRKNTNTKRVDAIMPNGSSQTPQFNAMSGLIPKTMNNDGLDGYNDNGGSFNVGKHSDRKLMIDATKEASPKRMKKQKNKEAKGVYTSDRNPMGEINRDAYAFGVKGYSERNQTYGLTKRRRGNTQTNEDNGDMQLTVVEDGRTQLETHDRRPKNKKKRGIENEVHDGKVDDIAMKNSESLPEDHVSLDCSNEAIQPEKLTHRKLEKWRQDVMRNEGEELHVDGGDHSPLDADGDSLRFTSQAPISRDFLAEVHAPFVSEHVNQHCNYCSKPIDEPIWSGFFRIDGEEIISLAGHLSTKSCDKVRELSSSLTAVVEVTKLYRSKFEIWETSKPSCDNIGLYFFPNKMRHAEDLCKLVKEVIEDDLVLQTVIGDVEMLIFPSTLLPERYKTFQRKHYLWGVFRPRQDLCATVAEPVVHDTMCCAEEKEKEEQHASNQQDEVQQVHCELLDNGMQQAEATTDVPGSPNMVFSLEALEERQLADASQHALPSSGATAVATNPVAVTTEPAPLATSAATAPAEATENDTNAATIPAEATENHTNGTTVPGNHGWSDSVVGVPSGSFFCFVAKQTPRLEQLIQQMQREGSLVVAFKGEAIGASSNISGRGMRCSPEDS